MHAQHRRLGTCSRRRCGCAAVQYAYTPTVRGAVAGVNPPDLEVLINTNDCITLTKLLSVCVCVCLCVMYCWPGSSRQPAGAPGGGTATAAGCAASPGQVS